MRPLATEVTEAARAYESAKEVTPSLIHRLVVTVAQDLANKMGGPVRVILPGSIVIERAPQDSNIKDARFARIR